MFLNITDIKFKLGKNSQREYLSSSARMVILVCTSTQQKLLRLLIMAKYRIIERKYPNGHTDYEVQKKILGLFWWNFNNIDAVVTGFYDTLEEAKMAIEMDRSTTKKTIINVK